MLEGFVDGINDLDRGGHRQEFASPVLFLCGLDLPAGSGAQDCQGAAIAVQLHSRGSQPGGNACESLDRDGRVYQQRVQRITDVGTANLGVERDVGRHLKVGGAVNIGVADADPTGDCWHGRVLSNVSDQSLAAARYDQVYVLVHLQQGVHQGAVGVVYKLDRLNGRSRIGQGATYEANKRGVGAEGFLASAQNAGIS